jgi:hypothetical protein
MDKGNVSRNCLGTGDDTLERTHVISRDGCYDIIEDVVHVVVDPSGIHQLSSYRDER